MPIYEYLCTKCFRKFSVLVGVIAESDALVCPRCGNTEVKKLVSRFSRPRSEDEILDSLEMSGLGDMDEKDPRSMVNWMKKLGKEMGEDFGDELDEALEEAMAEEAQGGPEESKDSS